MRFIKLAIISFVFFFVLITIVSLFIPSTVRISRAIDINRSAPQVMTYIGEQENWKTWYPGADSMNLSETLALIGKSDSTVLAEVKGRKKIDMMWRVISSPNVSTVHWNMDIKLKWYPWEKFSSLFFEKTYGARMEEGLGNLKQVVETARQ